MGFKIFAIFILFPLFSFSQDFDLTQDQEKLYGLEVTTEEIPIIIGKFGENNVPADYDNGQEELNLVDIVKTAQAAAKKEDGDELVFYDYTEEGSAKDDISKMAQTKKISGTVVSAIERELGKKEKIKEKKVPAPILDRNDLMEALFSEDAQEVVEDKEDSNANIKISIFNAKIDEGEIQKDFDFEFVPDYDSFDSSSDQGTGIIDLRVPLNSDMGIIRGTILKRNSVRTKLDLALLKKEKFIEVPLFDQEYLDSFVERNKLSGSGANVLLDIHESIISVDISGNYEAKIFLNENFKKVDEGKERYVFFMGLTPGNVLLRALNTSKEIGQKIIHINEGEIYFDQLGVIPGKIEAVALFEKNLLGKVNTELNIEGKDLKILNSDFAAKNIGINHYEYYRPPLPTGTRKYFELNHQNSTLFMGLWNAVKVELPDSDFRAQAMSQLNLRSLLESCLIHMNFSKPLSEFKAFGEGTDDGLDVEVYYLGKDGLISTEIQENTYKAFVVGNLPGIINGSVKYLDGTKDFFQSPCTQNTYLVEQF